MRKRIRIPAILALTLALALPALAQSSHAQHAVPPVKMPPATPVIDPNKADLLHQEFVAKTAELRGKVLAKRAELETLLATKPEDEAAIKKLVAEMTALRGALLEQTTLFRIHFAKETGMPIRLTRGFAQGSHGMMGPGGLAGGLGDKCGKDGGTVPGRNMMLEMMGRGMPAPAGAPKTDTQAPGAN